MPQDASYQKFNLNQMFAGSRRVESFENLDKECKVIISTHSISTISTFYLNMENLQGIWLCECQVAMHNFVNDSKITGLFIAFDDDLFAVAFIELYSVMAYVRVDNL